MLKILLIDTLWSDSNLYLTSFSAVQLERQKWKRKKSTMAFAIFDKSMLWSWLDSHTYLVKPSSYKVFMVSYKAQVSIPSRFWDTAFAVHTALIKSYFLLPYTTWRPSSHKATDPCLVTLLRSFTLIGAHRGWGRPHFCSLHFGAKKSKNHTRIKSGILGLFWFFAMYSCTLFDHKTFPCCHLCLITRPS
jgi:hypothetical protein